MCECQCQAITLKGYQCSRSADRYEKDTRCPWGPYRRCWQHGEKINRKRKVRIEQTRDEWEWRAYQRREQQRQEEGRAWREFEEHRRRREKDRREQKRAGQNYQDRDQFRNQQEKQEKQQTEREGGHHERKEQGQSWGMRQASEQYAMWKAQVDVALADTNSLKSFPFPLKVTDCYKCTHIERNNIRICHHELKALLKCSDEYGSKFLKKERNKRHPDWREQGVKLATEMLQLYGQVIDTHRS